MLELINKIQNNILFKRNIRLNRNVFPTNFGSDNISTDENFIFTQINCKDIELQQGFKIHISATMSNYQEILDIVYKFLKEENITFKYVSNKKFLNYILSNACSRSSAGKFITIYPSSFEKFCYLVEELYSKLKDFSGYRILTDSSYKNSIVQYRYGSFVATKDNILVGPNGEQFVDDRKPIYRLPSWVEEPFPQMEEDSKYIGKKYMVKSVIQHKVTGGVYIADYQGQDVVIKETIPLLGKETSKENNKFFEKEFILENKDKYFPEFIDHFEDCGHLFLVESKVSGIKLSEYKSTDWSSLENTEKIIGNILEIVKYFHDREYFIMDISDNNILVDKECNVYFIDLDNVRKIKDYSNLNETFRTKGFYNSTIDKLNHKQQDIQQIGYLLSSLFTKSHYMLNIDSTGHETFKNFLKLVRKKNIPQYIISLIYSMIYENKEIDYYINLFENKVELSFNYKNYEYIYEYNDLKKSLEIAHKEKELYLSNLNKAKISETLYGYKGIRKVMEQNICDFDFVLLEENYKYDEKLIEELILRDNYSLENGLSYHYINLINHNLLKESKGVEEYLINKLKTIEFLEKDPTGLFNGYLSIVYALSSNMVLRENLNINNTISGFIIKFSNKVIRKDGIFAYSQKILVDGNKYSPYLSDGSAGFLKTLVKYANNFKNNKVDVLIDDIATSLLENPDTQNATYAWGMLGIIDSLLDYVDYKKDGEFFVKVKNKFSGIEGYILKYKNNHYIQSVSLINLGHDIAYGSAGYLLVDNKIKSIERRLL